jgi:glycerol-3-phosphate dehydrogenase
MPTDEGGTTRTRLERDLTSLTGRRFDLLVVGGGIVGSCVARDAARRGLDVALIDRDDFSSGTSAASSKLVHGGVRYLRRFQLALVREALRERQRWATNAPHLVRPMPFLLPLLDDPVGRLERRAFLDLYELLAVGGPRVKDRDQRAPRHRIVPADTALRMEPALGRLARDGALVYYDYQAESPERLGLECVMDAVAHGAAVANHIAMTGGLRGPSGRLEGVLAEDRIGGDTLEVRARLIVNATGPWSDRAADLLGLPQQVAVHRSKGVHLVTRAFLRGFAVALPSRAAHLFAVPWRGRTIVGTTDSRYEGVDERLTVSEHEEADLLLALTRSLPGVAITPDDVVHRYAGLRPLVGALASRGDTYHATRDGRVVVHGASGDVISAVGGKWTTSRLLAERAVDVAEKRLGVALRPCDTATARLPLAPDGPLADHVAAMTTALDVLEEGLRVQLCHTYGTAAPDVLRAGAHDDRLLQRIGPDLPHIPAEAVYARREEMAVLPDDILFRRTSIGPLGGDTATVRRHLEEVLA